ncbi:LT_GEWL domain containing protein [uncultured Caudovirales phage]|uniref:LT_GEWL domain containing protein n=1 Tax=uncultured Caudovirales phage TaxID=2100421 RepID=A0A6J5L7S7_9CAUD|nr:LT_GEWL domain containing protein [uncultured Caudovirales phage]
MAAALLSSQALAIEEEDAGAFFRSQVILQTDRFVPFKKQEVVEKIAKKVSQELGEKWVQGALKIAKLESGFNCKATGPMTRHGRAKGLFQMIDSSAKSLGFDPKKMHDCDENIAAGVAHMKMCIQYGVVDARGMAACHVAGWGNWNVRLARRPERYKQHYIKLATA